MSAARDGTAAEQHVGDLAELHALGALEPSERAQVEAHVATCAVCAQALGDAESTVAALDDAFTAQVEPPARLAARVAASAAATPTVIPLAPRRPERAARPGSAWYAAAAALVLGVGVGGGALVEHAADVGQAARDSAVLATIATSHFNHVTLTVRDATAPVSKVLYARDGAWFYVVIDSAACDCRIVSRSAAGVRDLGRPTVRGSTATLFVRDDPRPNSIALVNAAGRVISEATLAYSAR